MAISRRNVTQNFFHTAAGVDPCGNPRAEFVPVSWPQIYSAPMLYEEHVVTGVRQFLERNGFHDIRCAKTTDHGEDIRAVSRDGTPVTIEAKGETSSRQKSSRYGKQFNSGQVTISVSAAFYSAASQASGHTLSGVAFPRNDAYVNRVAEILPALRTLKIEVFWVTDSGVEIERHWELWDEAVGQFQP